MNVNEAIKSKRAVRHFSDQPVPDEVILQILDAGRRSQSSKNTQLWHFLVVRDKGALMALGETGDYARHLSRATFAVMLIGEAARWNMFDLGQVAAYMQLAAWELGVGSCIAAIHRSDDARAILNIPADKTVDFAISFGYPAPDWKPAKLGGRKPITDVVRYDKWE